MTRQGQRRQATTESEWDHFWSSSWWDDDEELQQLNSKGQQGGLSRRRSQSQPRAGYLVETRNDFEMNGKATRRGRSESRGRSQSRDRRVGRRSRSPFLTRGRSASRARTTTTTTRRRGNSPRVATVTDANFLSRRGDNRQKKIVYHSFSDNPYKVLSLEVTEKPPTPVSQDHVVIKILASTVSYSDCLIRRGISFGVGSATSLPATPGMDIVGLIIQRGERVKEFNVGDRVAALVRTGGNARYISVPMSDLVVVPRGCDTTGAICMVSTYMTAYQCIRLATNNSFDLKKKRVLITAGTEPVGHALIQLCRRAGATEIFACGPNTRSRYIRTMLNAKPMSDDPRQWPDTVKGSMDVVFDGRCYDGLNSASAAVNKDGALLSIGMSALLNRETSGVLGAPMVAYWEKLKSDVMAHSTSYEVWNSFKSDKNAYKLDLEILFYLLRKRFIKPSVVRRVSLSEVADAHHAIEHTNVCGEIVCLPWKRIGRPIS